ncbi:MAG: hypothetical protein Q4E99_02225 [Bacillota bacterium]|nr:hypothetical protein [Bacillota bacterium]
MFVSEYFDLTSELNKLGVFDAVLDRDSHFFINVIRLKNSTIPEFVAAYGHLNKFFSEIATMLNAAETEDDLFYRRALTRFRFSEVNGINLGFAESSYGAGFGDVLSRQVLSDAFKIVKKGSQQPELFQLIGLFEDNVASDRLSDMIATIILPDIEAYTLRIYRELGITRTSHPTFVFNKKGLIKNPFKNASILLLPVEVLHELPIARDWYDIDRVVSENKVIREEMNAEIGAEWKKWATSDKKSFIKQHIFMQPEVCERVINGYRQETLEPFNPQSDTEYLAEMLLRKIRAKFPFNKANQREMVSSDGAFEIINIFKDWVENNKGWDDIHSAPSNKREKIVQRLLQLAGKYYVKINNLDFTFESDSGRGPVDLKLSRGSDKTIVEIKLSTNTQYLHGYEEQVQEYGKAESTNNLIYVFVDLGNPGRKKAIIKAHGINKANGVKCPELIIVDSRKKNAASTFDNGEWKLDDIDFSMDDMKWSEE